MRFSIQDDRVEHIGAHTNEALLSPVEIPALMRQRYMVPVNRAFCGASDTTAASKRGTNITAGIRSLTTMKRSVCASSRLITACTVPS
jgi:hypothetical protein